MALSRREFLTRTGLTVAAAAVAPSQVLPAESATQTSSLDDWSSVRAQFELAKDYIHLATFYIASHPLPVRQAIENYRRQIDQNPFLVVEHAMFATEEENLPLKARKAAAAYVGGKPQEIALTNSTTMGLALIYSGLPLRTGQEVLTTEHDHFSHHESIRYAALRNGATMRKIPLFDSYDTISETQIVERIQTGIKPQTRAVGITWVHSSSGLKLPMQKIAATIKEINKNRSDSDRVILVVDGVHGFGVENETIATMGVDFFAAGTHKWILGPRGTGLVWASEANWAMMRPTIPSFYSNEVYEAWMEHKVPPPPTQASWVMPGGFHPYEHEWAVTEAFEFHQSIGKQRIADRIHSLNSQCKEGLAQMKNVKLYTPLDTNLSAGLVCFDVAGMKPGQVVQKLLEKKIVASETPYGVSYARLAPSIVNTPEEIEITLREIRSMG